MKCIIECMQPLRNRLETITLKDGKVFFDDGRYEKIVLNDEEEVEEIYLKLLKIVFSWKQEYIGEKIYDGEKYLIEFDINHKRKKYKIQNKFPNNWNEFLDVRNQILDFCKE